MNKVIIHIKELGPVKDQTVELKPVMLFTGESSLGKSYVNFLSYYLFYILSSERMNDFLLEKLDTNLNNKEFSISLSSTELIDWLQHDVKRFFVYLYNFDDFKCDVKFEFSGVKDFYSVKYTRTYEKTDNSDNTDVSIFQVEINGKKDRQLFSFSPRTDLSICESFRKLLSTELLGVSVVRSFLLPPGRASLLTGDYTVQSGSSKLGLYDLFLRDNDFINSLVLVRKPMEVNKRIFSYRIHALITGDLKSEKEGVFLETEDHQKIPLGAAASSIKELAPLLQLMLNDTITYRAICIEEPEAHLHPEMQISIADLLASCANKQAFLQITTHSDYFLQRVNQLLKYGHIREQDPSRYNELCDETNHLPDCYLNKEDLNAYYFSSDKGQTKMDLLNIGDEGVPLSSFFNAVGILSNEDELLYNELERLKQE